MLQNESVVEKASPMALSPAGESSVGTVEVLGWLQVARLHFKICDFDQAERYLKQAIDYAQPRREWPLLLKAIPLLLRIYAEREELGKISETKELLADLVIRQECQLDGEILYNLGICAAYRQQVNEARSYFERALKEIGESDSLVKSQARFGLALCFFHMGQTKPALEMLREVESSVSNQSLAESFVEYQDLLISTQIAKSLVYRSGKEFDQARQCLVSAEEAFKRSPALYTHLNILYAKATLYHEMGQYSEARTLYGVLQGMIQVPNLAHYSSQVNRKITELNRSVGLDYDLLLDKEDGARVVEKDLGAIDFRNQFILFELLEIFAREPGRVFSKANLIERVWKASYSSEQSEQNDNKLYVTIKRLRKMVEPNLDKPHYILRRKGGYCLNPTAKVVIRER